MISIEKFFFAFSVVCSFGSSRGADFPWAIKLRVSTNPGSEYEGEVEIKAIFDDRSTQSIVLPSKRYLLGVEYTFPIQLQSVDSLQAVYIRTKGDCSSDSMPKNFLRLDGIELISKSINVAYSKQLNDLVVKQVCENSQLKGTQISKFVESRVSKCALKSGETYEHGDEFEMGCVGNCKCENGSIACVDMCAPSWWGPERKCQFVHVPGQCCDAIVCQDEQKSRTCGDPTIANVGADGGKNTVAVRRYPWSALYCMDNGCKEIQSGVIVGSRHILTFAPDLSKLSHLPVASGEYIVDQANISDFNILHITSVTAHPDFINSDTPVADSAARLQLVKFEERFSQTKTLQAANLPFDHEHCEELTKNDCPFIVVGWDRTDISDNDIHQWFLHTDKAKHDDKLCVSNSTTRGHPRGIYPRRRGEKRSCIGKLIRNDCTGPLGGAVVSSANADFLIGLTDPDASLFFCDHEGSADMLPLCKYIDWIKKLIVDDS